jgi:hypothetical protein
VIYAWNPTAIVQCISLVTLALAALVLSLSSPESGIGLWHVHGIVLSLLSGGIFLLTVRPVFRWVHKRSFARAWLFPLLDGEWEGEVYSNWPRVHAMLEAAKGAVPRFDALADDVPAAFDMDPVKVSATIKSGLLDFEITTRMSSTRRSDTIFVKPVWHKPARPRLYYLYRQQEDGKIAVTDAHEHDGAAYLDFDADTDTLSGPYWTQRRGDAGLNTAGRIRLWRKGRMAPQ